MPGCQGRLGEEQRQFIHQCESASPVSRAAGLGLPTTFKKLSFAKVSTMLSRLSGSAAGHPAGPAPLAPGSGVGGQGQRAALVVGVPCRVSVELCPNRGVCLTMTRISCIYIYICTVSMSQDLVHFYLHQEGHEEPRCALLPLSPPVSDMLQCVHVHGRDKNEISVVSTRS